MFCCLNAPDCSKCQASGEADSPKHSIRFSILHLSLVYTSWRLIKILGTVSLQSNSVSTFASAGPPPSFWGNRHRRWVCFRQRQDLFLKSLSLFFFLTFLLFTSEQYHEMVLLALGCLGYDTINCSHYEQWNILLQWKKKIPSQTALKGAPKLLMFNWQILVTSNEAVITYRLQISHAHREFTYGKQEIQPLA